MITGNDIAATALNSGLIGTPYSKMDCQAFVEEILKRAGLKIINYRGSNHMWRELVHDRESAKGKTVPAGALAFIVRFDGGEKKRGYHDDMGNATHVAISLGDGRVMESTSGGVQISSIARFTDYALVHDVDYDEDPAAPPESADESKTAILKGCIASIREYLNEMEEYLK